jgi:hypothetical protein
MQASKINSQAIKLKVMRIRTPSVLANIRQAACVCA